MRGELTIYLLSLMCLFILPSIVIAGQNDKWLSCCASGCDYFHWESVNIGGTIYYCCDVNGQYKWQTSACPPNGGDGGDGTTTTTIRTTTTTTTIPTTTTTIPTTTTTICNNECPFYGTIEFRCSGDILQYRACGNYDQDSCLEWSSWQNYINCNNYDGWYDTGNTRWVDCPDNKWQECEEKEQEYRDYYCSGQRCKYSVTDKRWVSTGNRRTITTTTIRTTTTTTTTTIPTTTTTICNNECPSYGATEFRCSGDILQRRVCGNYDQDSCLEWSSWQNYINCNNYDGWYDTGNTRWVDCPDNKWQECEEKEQEYRNYYCSGQECKYSVTDKRWVSTNNRRWKDCSKVNPEVYILTYFVAKSGNMTVSTMFHCEQWSSTAKNMSLSLKIDGKSWTNCFLNNKGLMTDFSWKSDCDKKTSGRCGNNMWECSSLGCKHKEKDLWVTSDFNNRYVNITFKCQLPADLTPGAHTLTIQPVIYSSKISLKPAVITFRVVDIEGKSAIEVLLLPLKILRSLLPL